MKETNPKRTLGSVLSSAVEKLASRENGRPAMTTTAPVPGTLATTLVGHVGQVRSVAFSPDGKTLLSTGYDCQVRLWDIGNRTNFASLSHDAIVRSAVFTPDGEKIVSGSDDGAIRIWDAKSRTLDSTVPTVIDAEGPPWIYHVCVSPNGRYALSCGYQATIGVVDLLDRTYGVLAPHHRSAAGASPIYCASFLRDSDTFLFGGFSGQIAKYKLSTGALETQWTGRGRVHSIAVSRDTDTWIAGGMNGNDGMQTSGWLSMEAAMGTLVYNTKHWVDRIAIAPDEKRLYVAVGTSRSTESACIVIDRNGFRETGELGSSKDRIHSVAVSPDGRLVAAACKDGTVGLWHAP